MSGLRPPIAKGEVRNPAGINQWTYRREAEKNLEKWCRNYGEALIDKVCNLALSGKPWAVKLLFERILPVVRVHEVEFSGERHPTLEAALDRILGGEASGTPAKPNGGGAA